MENSDILEWVRMGLVAALKRYQQDLEAIPADSFAVSPGAKARSAADFTAECTYLNGRFAKILRCQEPEPFSMDSWMVATGEAADKTFACHAFKESADDLVAALDELGSEGIGKAVQGFRGPTPAYVVANFAGMHVTYHDAQLNYIQTLHGDSEMHWG